MHIMNWQQALKRLCEGNQRFMLGKTLYHENQHQRRADLLAGQSPFAIILGCADSRVPAELVFDQGLGDLFVIRIAGNIVAPSQIGSVEFAVEKFGTPLIVVLGHTQCGAISATIEAITQGPGQSIAQHLGSIVKRIAPNVRNLLKLSLPAAQLEARACEANIRASVQQLRNSSEFLERELLASRIQVVGAQYNLESGQVHIYEDSII